MKQRLTSDYLAISSWLGLLNQYSFWRESRISLISHELDIVNEYLRMRIFGDFEFAC